MKIREESTMHKLWMGTVVASVAVGGAYAADLPVKAPPVVPAPVVENWSGLYIGGHGGLCLVERPVQLLLQ
jgi:hypothetical protein